MASAAQAPREQTFSGKTSGKLERAKRVVSSRRGASTSQRGKARSRGKGKAVGSMGPHAQRVVVKTHYVKMASAQGKARAKAHVGYLMREGVSMEGERGELYSAQGLSDPKDFLERSEQDPHQFRIILSPEMAHELDLTEYTKEWMRRMERDLGTKLDWVAVNHYNTDNYHTHVLIRGVDERGAELRIDRDYLSYGMRNRAQELATQELGPRTLEQVREARMNEVEQLRYTSLDRTLERRANAEHEIDLRHVPGHKEVDPSLRCDLLARARFLCEQERAQEVRPCVFVMQDRLKEELTELGKQLDVIAHLHQAGAKQPIDWCLDAPSPGEVIEAKVLDRGLADELKGREYLVLEDTEQRVRHIELGRHWEPDRARVGEWVKIEVSSPAQSLEQAGKASALESSREAPEQTPPRHAALHLRVERIGRLDELIDAPHKTWLDERLAASLPTPKHPELEAAQQARATVLEREQLRAREAAPQIPHEARAPEHTPAREVAHEPAGLSYEQAKRELQAIKDSLLERCPNKPILSAAVLEKNEGVLREEIAHKNARFLVLETDKHQILYRSTPELREQLGQYVEIKRGERGYEATLADRYRGLEL